MTLEELKTASMPKLLEYVEAANEKGIINMIVYELACRTYVPFTGVEFDDLLLQYGYQIDEKEKAARAKVKLKTK